MFNVMFIIIPIFIVLVFVFVIAMIISPKLRGKMMSRQFKSMRYMMEESKDDFSKIGNSLIDVKKNILDQNEDALTDMANKEAKIKSVGIKSAAKAIKEGLTENSVYCKHCGAAIDADSKFCKSCGKKL